MPAQAPGGGVPPPARNRAPRAPVATRCACVMLGRTDPHDTVAHMAARAAQGPVRVSEHTTAHANAILLHAGAFGVSMVSGNGQMAGSMARMCNISSRPHEGTIDFVSSPGGQIGDSKGLKWRTAPSLCAKVYVGTPQFFTTHQLATIVGTRL